MIGYLLGFIVTFTLTSIIVSKDSADYWVDWEYDDYPNKEGKGLKWHVLTCYGIGAIAGGLSCLISYLIRAVIL
jgi:hypothetical protein